MGESRNGRTWVDEDDAQCSNGLTYLLPTILNTKDSVEVKPVSYEYVFYVGNSICNTHAYTMLPSATKG